jgi:hypothetical protein
MVSVGGVRWIGSVRVVLRRHRQVVLVSHDVKMVKVTTYDRKKGLLIALP